MDLLTSGKWKHNGSESCIKKYFLYFREYPDNRCADYINILNINSMETTKTTEKFQSVHKTFSYTPKSALTNQWSSLAFGIGMVIVPLIYPFGLRIRRAVILSPEVLSTILIICGALLLLMTFFSIRKARVLAAQRNRYCG